MRQMMTMIGLVLALAVPVLAQTEVDQDEIRRLGNFVQETQVGPRAGNGDAFLEAMSPPASDADKWFITVMTTKNCAGCLQLKRAFEADPWLRALANPQSPQQSWSHYNVYSAEDRSQAFRFTNLRIEAYPTVIVQPPRSGKYGDASTVVYQGTYGGDPKTLAQEITSAIRQYIERRNRPAPAPPRPDEVSPPWTPAPKDEPLPLPVLPDAAPVKIPPEPYPQPAVPLIPMPVYVPQPQPAPAPSGVEAVVVTDADQELDEATKKHIDDVVAELRRQRGRNMRVRQVDWLDAQNRYPLRPEELPAVLVTSDGRIRDKITNLLWPCLRRKVLDEVAETLTPSPSTGFNIVTVLGVIGYVLYRLFGKRKQPPEPPPGPTAPPAPAPVPTPSPAPATPTDPKPAG